MLVLIRNRTLGLINQTYSQDSSATANLSQWQRFNRVLYDLNQLAPANTVYKLLFIGRHGEGYHNAEQTFVSRHLSWVN